MRLVTALALSALFTACGGGSDCEEEAYQCVGEMLQQCVDGAWADEEDCGALDGMVCHAEMGHCMAADDTGMSM